MGLSIWFDTFDGEQEIWQSCYSTFRKDASIANPEIKWEDMSWSYQQGLEIAEGLKIALLNSDFCDKWEYQTIKFIKGLEKAYDLKAEIVFS